MKTSLHLALRNRLFASCYKLYTLNEGADGFASSHYYDSKSRIVMFRCTSMDLGSQGSGPPFRRVSFSVCNVAGRRTVVRFRSYAIRGYSRPLYD